MLRTTVCALTCVVAATFTGAAQASYINFSFFGVGISGNGAVNVTANGNGPYTATSGSLLVLGDPALNQATLVANPNGTGVSTASGVPTPTGNYDNQISLATPALDANGLLFQNGTHDVFLRYVTTTGVFGPTSQYVYTDYNTANNTSITFNLANFTPSLMDGNAPGTTVAVPEPASLILMGLGCVGLLPFARKRIRSQAIAG